jgi:hypothetical protein
MERSIAIVFVGLCACLTTPARAQEAPSLTADDLKAIVAKPHDDTPALKGLEVFSGVRTWTTGGNFIDAQGKREPFKGKTLAKRVDGKYDVLQASFEGHAGVVLTMVITWDAKTDTYYQYMIPPRGPASKMVGLRVPNTRSIAWASAGKGPAMINVDVYDDKKMTWRSLMLDGKTGAITLITEGEATAAAE